MGDDQDKDIRAFPEPIAAIAMQYIKDITAEQAAFELGLADPPKLAEPREEQLGAARAWAWAPWPTAKRSSVRHGTPCGKFLSQFHRAASQLDVGTPHRQF